MNAKRIVAILVICFSCISITIYFFIIKPITIRKHIEGRRDELIETLGVNIEEDDRKGFPVNYFYEQLEPGMTINEVHEIVVGYDAVYRCHEDYKDELYYYFGDEEGKAIRFMIFYDPEGYYYDFISEDPNSLVFGVGECIEGLREE
ncbi:MAG: hypothetical protein U5K99_07450 [Anaerolineales bacterium]|nr:hypothetical protein [Anaerolineales bacterium]